MKRILCAILCLMLLLGTLTSCGKLLSGLLGDDDQTESSDAIGTEDTSKNTTSSDDTSKNENTESDTADADESENDETEKDETEKVETEKDETEKDETEKDETESEKDDEEDESELVESDDVEDDEEEEEEESETNRKDIETEDFSINGVPRDFTMLVRSNRFHYLWVKEDGADKVQHATFQRNNIVQREFGVKINVIEGGSYSDDWVTVLTGATGEYDIAVPDYWWLLEQQGFFLNLTDMSELEFDQDYWYDQWNSNVTINNKLYTVAGDASLEVMENIEIVFFNKMFTDALNLDMYEIVDNKEWTIDKMISIGKDVSIGLDTPDTSDDIYGAIYDIHSLRSQLFSAGLRLTEINDKGGLKLIASDASNYTVQEKVKELIYHKTTKAYVDGKAPGYTARNAVEEKAAIFETQAVFYATAMYCGSTINNTNADYGVVPMPMLEEGGDYISTSYGVSTFAIPKSCNEPYFSAVILDAINYYSYDTVVTGFYDTAMKAQVANSIYDARMMDIARDSLYFDFAWMLDQGGTMTVFNAYQIATEKQNTDLASVLAEAQSSSVEGLQKIILFYNQD